jgi:photosystem II stability/assembly factor-like uncharacterized protein
MYLSTDNGSSWSNSNEGIMNKHITALFLKDSILFVGTDGGGVYRSTDKGSNWKQMDNGMTNITIPALDIKGTSIIAGTSGNGVFVSDDNGLSWNKINRGITNPFINTIARRDNYVFAGAEHGDIFLSTNSGVSWQNANAGVPSNNSINCILIKDSSVVFASSTQSVYYSSNNGISWEPRTNGITSYFMGVLGQCGQSIFVTGYGGLFKSTDDGLNWNHIESSSGLADNNVNCLAAMDTIIFAGTRYLGVFRSTNYGTTWDHVSNWPPYKDVRKLAVNDSKLFALTGDSIIYISYDKGVSWISVSEGLPSYDKISAIGVNDSYLFAGMQYDNIWKRPFSTFVNVNDNPSSTENFTIFPNPASEYIIINGEKMDKQGFVVNIYNSLGALIKTSFLDQVQKIINLSNLNSGIYLVEIKSAHFRQIEKLIINK